MDPKDHRLPYANLERLVTTEMRPHNMIQGMVRAFYEEVRGENPISYDICEALAAVPGRRVALVTGFVLHPHLAHGEVDGPVGAAVLGVALKQLGYKPTVLVQGELVEVVNELLKVLGDDVPVVSTSDRETGEVVGWSHDYDVAVAIEKPGRNVNGVRHTLMGVEMPDGDSYVDDFFRAMSSQGKLTVAFGDGGNEIGFGKIYDFASRIVPGGGGGAQAAKGGIVAATATDHLFPAAVSNFGTFALAAALELHTGSEGLLPEPAVIRRLVETAVENGCLDGGSGRPGVVADDGIPVDAIVAVVLLLRTIVDQWRSTFERAF